MSGYFDVRKDSPIERKAQKAYVETLLADLLPPLRMAARGCGYAIAVHGSLCRDIDLIAIPWTENADDEKLLVDRLVGVIAGQLGRASAQDWKDMPHGRRAVLIYHAGHGAEIDLSVMPPRPRSPGDKQ
ncbi:hypothetical protein [Sphingomonas sp.]|uniref:hypothetical protein n=1 Tax=Sphingomonas sp. TaxID=28214 RepID=UPI0025CD7C69|nr:hypothetical protein [Sphingomonas sp.]